MELFSEQKKDGQDKQQQAPGTQGNILSQDKKPTVDTARFEDISSEVKTLTTRLRSLEEKYRNLRTSLQINEKNTLEDNKKKNAEMKDFNQEIFELKKSFKEIKDKMDLIIKELGLTSKREEVETIQRYLNLWNPVNFVNQKEIVPVVRRALLELGIKSKNDIEDVEDPNNFQDNKNQEKKESDSIF